MTKMLEPMLQEFRQEAATTRRVLERVPAASLAWRPHSKSMSLGQLSMHVAQIPAGISKLAQVDEFDAASANFTPPEPKDVQEILKAHDESVKAAEAYVGGLSEPSALGTWRMTAGGKEIFTVPRIGLLRTVMLNHWYHHRGQLSVYLRLLDVPLPSIYGPSADENPFV
jgi:uncharacterized damage-inducible protein DinB